MSTTGLGISISKKSADRITVCDELIFLCELINVDLSYKMTPATVLIDALLKDERLKHLGFINSAALVNKLTVNSLLCNKDNKEISEFLYSFGKSDRENQIKLVNAFKKYIIEIQSFTERLGFSAVLQSPLYFCRSWILWMLILFSK